MEQQFDFEVTGDFGQTEWTVKAITDKAKSIFAEMFGKGAVSVNIKPSSCEDLTRFLTQKGFSVI